MDANAEEIGHAAIADAVHLAKGPVVLIEATRQFGDVLHATMIVRHVRKTEPDAHVLLTVMRPFADAFSGFGADALGPHAIVTMPSLALHPEDVPVRVSWVRRASQLSGVRRAFGCGVGPWGWVGGTIVDAMLHNAGIKSLAVERRPWLPLTAEDNEAARRFILEHDLLRGFVTLEYCSASIAIADMSWYEDLVARCHLPVVALAGPGDPHLRGAVDGRGTSFRVAKALIARSSCFVGSGSGLGVMAASNGCEQPVVELVGSQLSMPTLGYRGHGPRYRNCHGQTAAAVAATVRQISIST